MTTTDTADIDTTTPVGTETMIEMTNDIAAIDTGGAVEAEAGRQSHRADTVDETMATKSDARQRSRPQGPKEEGKPRIRDMRTLLSVIAIGMIARQGIDLDGTEDTMAIAFKRRLGQRNVLCIRSAQ